MKKQILSEQFLRMQKIAGIITENNNSDIKINIDGNYVEINSDSGDYDGFIEDDGSVSFSVIYDDEEFTEYNWEDILGPNHPFVKIKNSIPTKVEALDDYVMITVKADNLVKI